MKTILVTILLLAGAHLASAQSCKIKIYYDANGNRTQRILECTSDQVVTRSEQKQADGFGSLLSGTYQVYPIPAENKVSVKLDAALLEKECSIVMTDISGKIVFRQDNVQQPVSEISLQGLADGAYLIQIISGSDRHTVKIVKQSSNGY